MRKESANFAAMFLPTRLFFQIATCSASYNRVTDHTEHVIAQKKVQIATRQRQNSYKSSLLDLMKNASSNLSFCTEIKIVKPSSVTKIKRMKARAVFLWDSLSVHFIFLERITSPSPLRTVG